MRAQEFITEGAGQKPIIIYTNNRGATIDDDIKKSLPVTQISFDQLRQWESHKSMKDPKVADWVNNKLLPELKQNGILKPLLVWNNNGEFFVIDGNHRFIAYQEAGYRGRVPVQIVPDSMITVSDTVPGQQGMAENKAAGINKMFNNLGDPVYANLQRVALLAMQGRQQEAAGRLQTVIKHADPAVQKKITDAVNNIKPVTINGRVADSSILDKSKQHNDWITNTFIPWVQSLLGQQGVAEGKQPGQPVVDAILKVMPIAQEIWFHGSRATGKHSKNSDTDILVVVPDDLVGDQYLGVVRILQKLSRHFDNYDIQPTHPGYNIHLIAQEEGQLLWSNKQGMAEGLTETRNSLFAFVKQQFPTWPDYVLKDFLYPQAKGIRDQAELDDFLKRNKQDFGNCKWTLTELPITFDIFTPKTQRMLASREGGSSNPFQVPRDAERHAQQSQMIQQKGVSAEPIIVAKLSNGYDLIEGWHRTIQHLKAFPQGYTGPAWVCTGATYKSESIEHENFAEGRRIGRTKTIIQKFVDSPSGQKYKAHDCKTVTRTFVAWAEQNNIPTEVITFAPPSAEFVQKNPQLKGKSGQGDGHIMPIVNGNAIDFTIRQFGVNRPFDNPLVTPVSNIKSVYSKFGYFTDTPDWFLNGKTHWRGPLKSIPSTIFNQDFGDELLENFADGKKPGRKGLAKRSGVDTKASVSSLRKTAKNSSGEKQRMAHWLANMKAGRAKAKRK